MKLLTYLLLLIASVYVTGCSQFTMATYQESVSNGNYQQAAIRLERCSISTNSDKEKCQTLLDEFKKYKMPLHIAIHQKLYEQYQDKVITNQRKSSNPWDMLDIVLKIQEGKIQEAYNGEQNVLLEKAFFGFGECAKENNPVCMAQYAQMIIYGSKSLNETSKNEAIKKSLYWLNLAARYGDESARKQLIALEEPIPTPDLAMEILQRKANALEENAQQQRVAAARMQQYYNSQMLSEARRQSFISSMNQFFPKTVNCTSNTAGGYTYTNCR